MTVPLRIQRKRTKGYRLPANTKCVTRPGLFGNCFTHDDPRIAIAAYRRVITAREMRIVCHGDGTMTLDEFEGLRLVGTLPDWWFLKQARTDLRGHNLACYCPLCPAHRDGKPLDVECPDCSPCHVDVLGQVLYWRNGQ